MSDYKEVTLKWPPDYLVVYDIGLTSKSPCIAAVKLQTENCDKVFAEFYVKLIFSNLLRNGICKLIFSLSILLKKLG